MTLPWLLLMKNSPSRFVMELERNFNCLQKRRSPLNVLEADGISHSGNFESLSFFSSLSLFFFPFCAGFLLEFGIHLTRATNFDDDTLV